MITKSIISRQPNGNISITYYDDRDDYNKIVEKHITLKGHTLEDVVDGVIETPQTKENRDCWDFDSKAKKVVEDSDKVQAKVDLIAQKESDKQAILSKLGLTAEELSQVVE